MISLGRYILKAPMMRLCGLQMSDGILWVVKWVLSFLGVSLIGPRHLQRVQQ